MSTPTSTISSRKRKADDNDESSSGRKLKLAKPSSSSSPAHLPASCLAAILNFMEYAEVRRCLLAGKIMAVDAANHVETLNIMNASELVPSAARRFANVTEINILSLVKDNDEDEYFATFSADTAARSVLFLTAFPHLKHAFLGGLCRDTDYEKWFKLPYFNHYCNEPKDHQYDFHGLVDQLCGAFRSRSLSPSLHLEGFCVADQLRCDDDDERDDGYRCRRCWTMATSFPPELVLEKIPYLYTSGLCLSYSERIEALATRNDNPLRFQPQAVTKCFIYMTKEMLSSAYVHPNDGVAARSFIKRMKSQGGKVGNTLTGEDYFGVHCFVRFYFMKYGDMAALRKLSAAIGPSVMNSVPKSELLSAVSPLGEAAEDGKKPVLVRQTFESLVQLGFNLASKDFVLIDPLNESALKPSFRRFFRPEEEAS